MEVELKKDISSNAMKCSVCGTIIVHSANHLPQGTILNGFEIISEIGRGGMGIVYNASQLNLDRSVALKVLSDDLARDEEFVERFFKEARAAASLNHSNIVQVFDAGSTLDGIYYFAMELISGETIESRIEREGAFPSKEAMKIAVKISDALDYAWKSQKLTHGDIKPENIILNEFGEAKLADLGLAKFTHEEVSTDGIMVTPLYAPPEIIRADNREISFKSDMYSFGATLYQMLAGVPPFPDGPPEQLFLCHLNETPPSLSIHNDKLAAPLIRIVDDLLAKDPDKRAESWEALCKSLKRIKEPEGAGKVFRKRSHIHNAQDESSSDLDKRRQETEDEDGVSAEPASISLMIKVLSALALILLVAIAGVLSMTKHSSSKGTPAAVSPRKPSVAKPTSPLEEWNELQRRMNAMNDKNSLAALKAFVAKHGRNCPPAALKRLRKTRNKTGGTSRGQKENSRFNTNANNLEKRVGIVLRSKKTTESSRLADCQKRINALFNQMSRKPYLKLPKRQRNFFRASLAAIKTELIERGNRLKKQARALQERKRLEKLAEDKLLRKKRREKRAAKLAAAAATDAYYKLLASFEDKPKLSLLANSLLKWRSESKNTSSNYSARADFIIKTIIPNSKRAYDILKKHKKSLVGHKLPKGVCSKKFSKFTVKEITAAGIKLNLRKGAVSLGKTLKWSKISPQKMVALLKKVVLDNKNTPPSQQEERVVLSYAVIKSPDVAGYLLTSLRTLRLDEIQKWKDIICDMNEASRENGLARLYERLCDDLKAGDKSKASEKFIKLSAAGKESLFAKRYADELKTLKPLFAEINPKITAAEWADKILARNQKQRSARKVFDSLMSFYARYGNILASLDAKVVEELSSRREEVLAELVRESGVTEMKDNRVPFYYWVKERRGGAWAFFKLAERSPRLKALPKLLASMQLAAALDNGDWETSSMIFSEHKAMTSNELVRIKRLRPWLPSFVFADGIVASQYGDSQAVSAASSALIKLAESASRNTAVSTLSTTLAMEFSISRRDNEATMKMGDAYAYNDEQPWWWMEGRIPLLNILARCMANQKPKKAILSFSNRYKGNAKLAGDSIWLDSAARLISGEPLNQNRIQKLDSTNCHFSDTTARIMSSALAQYYIETEKEFNNDNRLLSAIEKRLSPSIVSSDLWRRTLLLRLARAKTPRGFAIEAKRRLADLRICSSRAYPLLLELKLGAEVAEGKLSPDAAKKILSGFLKASLVPAKDELDLLSVMTGDDPGAVVKRLFAEHRPAAAVRAALLAIAMRKESEIRTAVSSILQENASTLQWEELYILRIMERWRR